ncbi:MAG: T9SS C-terminal target domain-containing protein, partial [Bacteroidetes bacterium]
GLNNLTSVGGLLKIGDNPNLINISSLSNLQFIGGNLVIIYNDNLETLTGLEGIQIVNGNFYLEDNDQLANVNGLNNLATVTGEFRISWNTFLSSLSGLENLQSVEGNFKISGASNLPNLTGLENLTEIGNDFEITSSGGLVTLTGIENITSIGNSIRIAYNNSLLSLTEIPNLQKISGDFEIYHHLSLISIEGFEAIDTISGNCYLRDNDALISLSGLDNLEYVGGTLTVATNENLATIGGLNSLVEVGTDITIENCDLITNLDGLENLTSVPNGDFNLLSNHGLQTISGLENLTYIDRDLEIQYNYELNDLSGLENLSELGGNLTIRNNGITTISSFNEIDTIYGSLSINNNLQLSTLNAFNNLIHVSNNMGLGSSPEMSQLQGFEKLNSVGNNLNISSTGLESFTGLDSLVFIGNNFTIWSNEIQNLQGLNQLDSIGNNISIHDHPNLVNFTGLENINSCDGFEIQNNSSLENFEGFNNLNDINNLIIMDNPALIDFQGLNELDFTQYIWIENNSHLYSLTGLENLNQIQGRIHIKNNNQLNSINAIANIDPNTINANNDFYNDLEIFNNPQLAICEVESICGVLSNPEASIEIYNNAPGCNSEYEIDCSFNSISGHVYFDLNQNGQRELHEEGIPNMTLNITPPNQTLITYSNGRFVHFCDEGVTYNINLSSHPDWQLTTDSSSYTILFEPGNPENSNNNFGLYPTFSQHTGDINLSSDQTRCNTDVNFYLRYQNTGTFLENGQVKLTYAPTSSFVSAVPEPDEVDNDNFQLIWNYDSLFPFQYRDILLTLSMPDENSTGESIHFYSEMFRDSIGMPVLMNDYLYSPIVLCSYDPNDKLVMPPGVHDENYTLHDEKLTYTIRFQNTGNAEAIDIRILDTLDTNLDLTTFRVLNSSFPVQTSLDGYHVEFFFNNIWLPDSTSNEPASHGFVTYEISPNEGLEDYTEIKNTAHIIFDFNPPIVTNTTRNTMVEMIPSSLEKLETFGVNIFPNPASQEIFITCENGKIDKVWLTNHLGQKILETRQTTIDVSHLPAGMYFLNVEVEGRLLVEKLIFE